MAKISVTTRQAKIGRWVGLLRRCGNSTADITTFNILINSTLSTEDAQIMMMDIKNYYMGTTLPRHEYMRMLLSRFPEEIVNK
jgi:tRNA A-37 threonylcarbamoyl transferase component Bud32